MLRSCPKSKIAKMFDLMIFPSVLNSLLRSVKGSD